MVAAWMSAETGVGPSIASGNQTWSGNWALLPTAPRKMPMAASVISQGWWSSTCFIGQVIAPSPEVNAFFRPSKRHVAVVKPKQDQDAGHETEVADPVRDERLVRRVTGGRLLEPVTDQEVGTEADQLPEEEHHDEVRSQHDAGHGEHEERQPAEVARPARIVLHVAERVDVHQHAHEGDDEHHPPALVIDDEADVDREGADLDEGKQQARMAGDIAAAHQKEHGADPDDDGDHRADEVRGIPEKAVQQQNRQRRGQRQQEHHGGKRHRFHGGAGSALQLFHCADIHALFGAEERDDDREPDRDLRGGDRDGEEHERLGVVVRQSVGVRRKREKATSVRFAALSIISRHM